MAVSGGSSGLGARIIAIVALAVLVTAGLGALAVWLFGRPAPVTDEASALERSFAAYTTFQQERFQRLELAARLLGEDRVLIAALAESESGDADSAAGSAPPVDSGQLASILRRRLSRLGCDVALLVAGDGTVVARSDSQPGGSTDGLAAATGGPSGDPSASVWQEDGRLYYTARAPVAPDFRYSAVAALAVDDLLAIEIKRAGGAEAAFYSATPLGPQLVGSSAPDRAASLLGQLSGLGGPGGPLERVLAGDGPIPESDFTAGGVTYRGLLTSLDDAAGQPAGAAVLFAPPPERSGSSRLPVAIALGVGGLIGLLLATPLALSAARRTAGPISRLVDAVDAVRGGDLAQRTAGLASGVLAPLGRSLDRLFGDLHERRSLSAVASAASRGDSSAAAAVPAADEGRRTLLAADLRRFASPSGDGVDDTVTRWQRDVRQLSALAADFGGDFEGALGHRLLASFHGGDAAERALAAAAAGLAALGEPENAFDDGEPPALAMAEGNVVRGEVATPAGSSRLVAGSTLQFLDSLLREAQPGEVVVSPPLAHRLGAVLLDAGVELVERPGMLTPRPVPVLAGAAAARWAEHWRARAPGAADATRGGSRPPEGGAARRAAEAAAGASGPGALSPGDVVGGRFEVVEALGSSAAGSLLRARDRELGEVVALKVLAAGVVPDPGAFERLDSPLQPVRKLDHPSVARTYDYGRAGERVFFAREPVAGVPLPRLLENPGRLPAAAVLALARQLAEGVGAAHLDGVAHGRLTPGNVVLGLDGRARITDFGVSLAVDSAAEPAAGLAPEGGASPAGDVYAVAALTVRALSGSWPAAGEPFPEGLPEGLAAVLATALAPEPGSRPADGLELARALDAVYA